MSSEETPGQIADQICARGRALFGCEDKLGECAKIAHPRSASIAKVRSPFISMPEPSKIAPALNHEKNIIWLAVWPSYAPSKIHRPSS